MRWSLLFGLLLAACSKGPAADLPSIGEARSLGAEWALVNEQSAGGHLSRTYVDSMHRQLRKELRSSLDSLTQSDTPYGDHMRALLAEQDDARPETLREHVRALKRIEHSLESA